MTSDTLCCMSEPEHPAAKAGRFVRAAGLAISREIEKQAAKPPKTPRAATAASARPAQAPPVVNAPPPPPPFPTGDFIGRVVFYSFILSLFAFLFVALRVEMLFSSTPKLVLQLVLAANLFLVAYLLMSNWQKANQRLAQRLLNRVWGARGPVNRREKFFARAARDGLTLIGILWLALGTLEFLSATVGY